MALGISEEAIQARNFRKLIEQGMIVIDEPPDIISDEAINRCIDRLNRGKD